MFSSGQEAELMYILVVLVEAFARLTVKLAAANHLSKKRLRTVHFGSPVSRLKYFHDSQNNVQTYQVAQFKRSHRMVSTNFHSERTSRSRFALRAILRWKSQRVPSVRWSAPCVSARWLLETWLSGAPSGRPLSTCLLASGSMQHPRTWTMRWRRRRRRRANPVDGAVVLHFCMP